MAETQGGHRHYNLIHQNSLQKDVAHRGKKEVEDVKESNMLNVAAKGHGWVFILSGPHFVSDGFFLNTRHVALSLYNYIFLLKPIKRRLKHIRQ